MVVLFWIGLFVLAIWPFFWGKRDSLCHPIPENISFLFHTLGWIIRALPVTPLILYMFGVEWIVGYLLLAYACYFSFIFDVRYNTSAYKDPWRVGIMSWWDKALGGAGFVLKPLGFILFVGAYLFSLI